MQFVSEIKFHTSRFMEFWLPLLEQKIELVSKSLGFNNLDRSRCSKPPNNGVPTFFSLTKSKFRRNSKDRCHQDYQQG